MVIRIKFLVWSRAGNEPQIEPIIEKGVDEVLRAGIVQEPFGLGTKNFGAMQFAFFRELLQFLIRAGVPKEI